MKELFFPSLKAKLLSIEICYIRVTVLVFLCNVFLAIVLFSRSQFSHFFISYFSFHHQGLYPFHFSSILRRGRHAWWRIHPLSYHVSVDVKSNGSLSASEFSFSCFSLAFGDRRRHIYNWKDSLHIASGEFWSKTICKANEVVETLWKHHQGYRRKKS